MPDLAIPTLRILIDRQAEELGERSFLIDPQTGRTVSYFEFRKDCIAVGRLLLDTGLAKGDHIALLLDNGLPAARLLLGIAYAGMVAVPLNVQAGESELINQLKHSGAKALFLEPRFPGRLADARLADLALTIWPVDHAFMFGEDHGDGRMASLPVLDTGAPAFLVYTSGSSGHPKGVLVSHGNLAWGARNTADAHCLTPGDRSLCVLPLYHMNAQVVTLLATLWSGGSVVIPSHFTTDSFWKWAGDYGCTWFALTPTLISQLIEAPGAAPRGPGKVRFARSSSGPLAVARQRMFEERFQLPLIEAMGMTEAGGAIFSNPLPPKVRKAGSIGIPYGFEAKLVNPWGVEVETGELGEIAVRGPSVMMGYLGDPAATRQVIDAEGWLRTGDLAYMDADGYFFIKGREKEMINRGGEKIAPAEVDAALLAHPGVIQAVSFAIPHPTLHEEVAAAVVPRAGWHATESALRRFLFERLSPFKVPRRIWLVPELPLGPTGKPLRREVQARFAALAASTATAAGAAPMSSVERTLAALWAKVLNLPRVEAEDDFFLLGGDSLSWVKLIIAIESEFRIELPLDDFLRRSTVRELAAWLEQTRNNKQDSG